MELEYEVFEPDPLDEYYDELVTFMFNKMFNMSGNSGIEAVIDPISTNVA